MRKLFAPLAALALIAAMCVPAEAKKSLRLALQLPLRAAVGQNLVSFKEEVEELTKGELEIQIFDSAQLFGDKDVPNAVGTGQIEMGVASLSRFAGVVPAVDVLSVPFLFDSPAKLKAATASDSAIRKPLDEGILKGTGCRPLWWQTYSSTVLLSKGAPVKDPDDLIGRRVRVFGKLLSTWVSSNGGVPVIIPGSEQYAAYKRAAVDIGMAAPDAIRNSRLWEVMDTVTLVNVAATELVVVIGEKVWQELNDDERQAITQAARNAEIKMRGEFALLEKDALESLAQSRVTIYKPTLDAVSRWRKSAKAAREEFLKGTGDLGRQVYEAALALE